MKLATYQTKDAKDILDRIFSFLAKSGLENISIRELCRGTGIVQGSLYYWFSDKTTIICEATEYGLHKITDEIFDYVLKSLDNLPEFFQSCLEKIGEYKNELRFIYQMAASPVYGEKIRGDGKIFQNMYDEYALRLAQILHCDSESIKPIVYLFISAVCDYVIWEGVSNAQVEIDFINSILPQIINN